jgi:hypothetical protein
MDPHLFQTTIRLLIPLNLYLWTTFCRPRIFRSYTVATQETVNFNVENFARPPVTSKHSKLNLPMIRKFAAFLFTHSKQKVCPCMNLATKLRGKSSQLEPLLSNSSKFIGNVPIYQVYIVFNTFGEQVFATFFFLTTAVNFSLFSYYFFWWCCWEGEVCNCDNPNSSILQLGMKISRCIEDRTFYLL